MCVTAGQIMDQMSLCEVEDQKPVDEDETRLHREKKRKLCVYINIHKRKVKKMLECQGQGEVRVVRPQNTIPIQNHNHNTQHTYGVDSTIEPTM